MPRLNKVYRGSSLAARVYKGASLVWQAAPAGDLLWTGGYDTADFSQWSGIQAPAARQPTIVTGKVRRGTHAARFELQANDEAGGSAPGHRSEVYKSDATGGPLKFKEGDIRWFSFSVLFESAAFGNASAWGNGNQMVVQWKNDGTGSAPLELRILDGGATNDGRLAITDRRVFNYTTGLKIFWAGPRMDAAGMLNVWHDFEVGVHFSSNNTVGWVEVYYARDGGAPVRQTMAAPRRDPVEFTRSADGYRVTTDTLKSGSESYIKQGYYTGGDMAFAGVVYHDGMRYGTTREIVTAL